MWTLYRTASSEQKLFVFFVILLAVFATNISYVVGFVRSIGTDYSYLWPIPFNISDSNAYFSQLQQVAAGQPLIGNLFSSEAGPGTILHPLWMILGWIGGVFQLSPMTIFHAARVALGIFFILFLYYACDRLLVNTRTRNIAFFLIVFSSGLGGFFSQLPHDTDAAVLFLYPMDLWVAESNTFLTLIHSPLFILSQILLVAAFLLFTSGHRQSSRLPLVCLTFFLVLMHPYDAPALLLVPIVFVLARRVVQRSADRTLWIADLKNILLMLGITGCVGAYYFATITENASLGGWAEQNVTPLPPLNSFLIGYGALLPFVFFGVRILFRDRKSPQPLFLLCWLLTQLALLALPVQVNRRFLNGMHIILGVVAAVGITPLFALLQRTFRQRSSIVRQGVLWASAIIVVLFFGFSNIFVVQRSIAGSKVPSASLFYVSNDTLAAIRWIDTYSARDSIVLTGYAVGNILPALTPRHVFLGHWGQTAKYEEKRSIVHLWFYRTNGSDEEKEIFLKTNKIHYVFLTPAERRLGTFAPDEKDYLSLVFTRGDASVYRVLSE